MSFRLYVKILLGNGYKKEQQYLLVLVYEEAQLPADIPTYTHLFLYYSQQFFLRKDRFNFPLDS
jgi:hypothetical protein